MKKLKFVLVCTAPSAVILSSKDDANNTDNNPMNYDAISGSGLTDLGVRGRSFLLSSII